MKRNRQWISVTSVIVLLLAIAALAACSAEPETIIEQVEVEVTRLVEGETVTVIETRVVEVAQEILITPTAEPGRSTLIVALASAPTSLDPADHRDRNSETVLRNMFDGLVTRDTGRSEEHTSELQSRENLVCRLLLEKK